MTGRLRSCFAVLICALLVITGQSMAVVRGASAATGQMVICVGETTSVIYTDAEGEPTSAPHICPDCLAPWAAEPPAYHDGEESAVGVVRWKRPTAYSAAASDLVTVFDARGPPHSS